MKDYWCEESRANLKHMQLDWNLFVRCVVTADEIHRVTACLEKLEMSLREFDSCHGNVRDYTKSQGSVREKLPKTVYC